MLKQRGGRERECVRVCVFWRNPVLEQDYYTYSMTTYYTYSMTTATCYRGTILYVSFCKSHWIQRDLGEICFCVNIAQPACPLASNPPWVGTSDRSLIIHSLLPFYPSPQQTLSLYHLGHGMYYCHYHLFIHLSDEFGTLIDFLMTGDCCKPSGIVSESLTPWGQVYHHL